ncbi:SAM-dependent methyltransferase [Streptomyces acidicola]|uniref:SAM-dependent methyltransferase n=1 Tax=Streptomyces acidicola TaxID=2596892 RepID=UPI00341C6168
MTITVAAEYWDRLYANRPTAPDPRPNVRLTEATQGLKPGDALDLGCGPGGDALWLARQGWQVTAVDVSTVTVERLTSLAAEYGLSSRITARPHDLHQSFPDGTFDLVNAHYLHTPLDLDRPAVLRAAARALRPNGRLIVVDHGSTAPWSWNQAPDVRYPAPLEVAADLGLAPRTWQIETAHAATRSATGPDGLTADVTDHILIVRRVAP